MVLVVTDRTFLVDNSNPVLQKNIVYLSSSFSNGNGRVKVIAVVVSGAMIDKAGNAK